jgi:hypothetical protein
MRALATALVLTAVAGGCATKDCRDNTILLALSFDSASAQADHLSISVTIAGGTSQTGSSARGPMGSSGTLEIVFGSGYPAGKSVTVTVTAQQAGATVGMGSASTTLSGKCARLPLAVTATGISGDMAGVDDMSASVSPDMTSAPDMASCVPTSASVTHWVDPALGHDDVAHGALPGNCAYKTLTYALAHATGRINLANVLYGTGSETFPITLTGTQIVDCDPTATGTRGQLAGSGTAAGFTAVVELEGTANQLLNCDVSTAPEAGVFASGECIVVNGAHTIDNCNLHACATGFEFSSTNGATITNTVINVGSNCFNAPGNNVTMKKDQCTGGNDCLNNCGTGDTGCGCTLACGTPCNGGNCFGPPNVCTTITTACP